MKAKLLAGIPAENSALFHRVRFNVGDPAAWIELEDRKLFIVRDIEVDRARAAVKADQVVPPAEFTPAGGLSATALPPRLKPWQNACDATTFRW